TVTGTPAPTAINAGAADTIMVGDSTHDLNIDKLNLTVDAHGGSLTFDDRGTHNGETDEYIDTYQVSFTITDQTVTRQAHLHEVQFIDTSEIPGSKGPRTVVTDRNYSGTIGYQNVSSLALQGGPVETAFQVQSTSAGAPVTVNSSSGGGTVNRFVVGAGGSVKNIRSQLTLNGSGSHDTLLLDDSQATTQDMVTVTSTQVGAAATDQFFGAGGRLTYGGPSPLTPDPGPPAHPPRP